MSCIMFLLYVQLLELSIEKTSRYWICGMLMLTSVVTWKLLMKICSKDEVELPSFVRFMKLSANNRPPFIAVNATETYTHYTTAESNLDSRLVVLSTVGLHISLKQKTYSRRILIFLNFDTYLRLCACFTLFSHRRYSNNKTQQNRQDVFFYPHNANSIRAQPNKRLQL